MWILLQFVMVFFGFFMVYDWLKMADQGLGTYSNTCVFVIVGASKISTKVGPLDPLFITKIFRNIQENPRSCFEKYHFYISQHLGNPKQSFVWKVWDLKILKVQDIKMLRIIRAFWRNTEIYDEGESWEIFEILKPIKHK